jgi:hypothetical protein
MSLALFAVALPGLAGCSQPVATPHGVLFQESANAEIDWESSVNRVMASMEAQGLFQTPGHSVVPGRQPYPGPYFVFVQRPGSAFLEDARDMMEHALIRHGAAVARSPVGATVINIDLDVIHWGALEPVSDTELVWRAGIIGNSRVVMKSTDLLYISDADRNLYEGTTRLAPLASPGVSLLGAAMPLRYAR